MFQDVQEGGAAHHAGVCKNDLLLRIDAEGVRPPERVLLRPGRSTTLQIRKADGTETSIAVEIPVLKSKQPFSTPQAVLSSMLESNIGYLKINMFPGIVGIDVARDIDRAVFT